MAENILGTGSDQQPAPPEQEFLTLKQTANYLNISATAVYRLCASGKLGHYRFGQGRGAIRINRTELLEFIQRCRIEERRGQVFVKVAPRKNDRMQAFVSKHFDFRPMHACGAITKAGTPCKLLTQEDRCYQHRHIPATSEDSQ